MGLSVLARDGLVHPPKRRRLRRLFFIHLAACQPEPKKWQHVRLSLHDPNSNNNKPTRQSRTSKSTTSLPVAISWLERPARNANGIRGLAVDGHPAQAITPDLAQGLQRTWATKALNKCKYQQRFFWMISKISFTLSSLSLRPGQGHFSGWRVAAPTGTSDQSHVAMANFSKALLIHLCIVAGFERTWGLFQRWENHILTGRSHPCCPQQRLDYTIFWHGFNRHKLSWGYLSRGFKSEMKRAASSMSPCIRSSRGRTWTPESHFVHAARGGITQKFFRCIWDYGTARKGHVVLVSVMDRWLALGLKCTCSFVPFRSEVSLVSPLLNVFQISQTATDLACPSKPEPKSCRDAIIDKSKEKALTKNTWHMHGLCSEKALTEKRTPKILVGNWANSLL